VEGLSENTNHRCIGRLQELLLSYNIGLPVDVRERDMNKRAAQLVGLKLPEKAE
jgi:hypothetical protein